MEKELTASFPNWPLGRVITEAVAESNALHGTNLDSHSSAWSVIYGMVLDYLRHRFTSYDSIFNESNREQLQEEILLRARRAYPWLRYETDPRCCEGENRENLPESPERIPYFTKLSKHLADLYTDKNRLTMALSKVKDPAQRAALKAELEIVNELIATGSTKFAPMKGDDGRPGSEGMRWLTNGKHVPGQYNLENLPEYRTKSAGIKCSKCGLTVMRSKGGFDFGNGIKLVLYSCHCISFAVTYRQGNLRFRVTTEGWEREVASIAKERERQQAQQDNLLERIAKLTQM